MTEPRKNARKTPGKPFAPGDFGRPNGSRHKVTLAIEALLDGQHEALTRKAIEKALEGDMIALRLCLDRIAPARKDSPVSVALPPIRTTLDVVAASAAVLASLSAGNITPDEAGRVMGLLSAHKSIVETADLEARIAKLEESQ